jgi:ankyrin repeat protein
MSIYKSNFIACNIDNVYKNNELKSQLNLMNDSNHITDDLVIDACRTSNLKTIKVYLESGHKINKFLITGWPLLLHAASYAEPKVIQYLLNLDSNPNLHYQGYTPLMALCNSTKGSVNKRLKCLRYLNEAKVDVNAVNKFKQTALMFACNLQEKDFILELLKHVNHINFADSEGKTALFYAVTNNRYDITNILIDKGADINWSNYEGTNAYDIAISKRYDKLIPLLNIDYYANIENNIKTNYISYWIDLLPTTKMNKNCIDSDIMSLLNGMGLESYNTFFYGIDLKQFFKLNEKDLRKLGIDISVHRKKFADELLKFHVHEWKNNLFKMKKTEYFSVVQLMTMLKNIKKQLTIISSTVHFSKNFLDSIKKPKETNLFSDNNQKLKFQKENVLTLVLKIKSTINLIKAFAQKINCKNSDLPLPIFINKKTKTKRKSFVIAIISLTSIYILRKIMQQKLCIFKILTNIFNCSLRGMRYISFNMMFINMKR